MKNKCLIALAVCISNLKLVDLAYIVELQKKLNEIQKSGAEGVDTFLEFKIGLHKFLSLHTLKLTKDGVLSDEEARLSNNAIQLLFDGKCGWWYENHFINHYAGFNRVDATIKFLYQHILFEAMATTDEDGGQIMNLTQNERMAIVMHKGLGKDPIASLEAIGEELRMSRERVRQMKEHAARLILNETENRLGIKLNLN